MIDRRGLLLGTGAAGLAAVVPARAPVRLPAFFDDLEARTFSYFWETANRENGLVPDRWPTPSFSSIAAVGFALTAYPIGAERGWITRDEARGRTLATLRFFDRAPQGPASTGVSGHKGFFYHFLDMGTGLRHNRVELSTVDTALLHLGMLFAAGWFDGTDPVEREIRDTAERIVARADWPWFRNGGPVVSMGWRPESGFIPAGWRGYNEGMMVWLLALGSAGRPIADDGWSAWTGGYAGHWRGEGPTRRLAFAPMFGHQYSHVWIDFRGLYDAPMRRAGFDYFENSRRATHANRAYCAANPMGWAGYSREVWGLTACDGPGGTEAEWRGRRRRFHGYAARGPVGEPDGLDDGTIAPTAALGSMPFAPEICAPAAEAMHRFHGARIYGRYGFLDSFNPSFRRTDLKVETGTVDPEHGWVARDWLGIDQGPILLMPANHRTEAVWRVMRRSSVVRRGLRRAGFQGGWLEA